MKCQILFSRKKKKYISKCCLLNFLPSIQKVKQKETIRIRQSCEIKALDVNRQLTEMETSRRLMGCVKRKYVFSYLQNV